jgi:integrase
LTTAKITKRSVDAMIPPDTGADYLWDDELRGFGLRITKNGARSYVYQYRVGGREAEKRRFTIGKHGSPWTAVTARAEAERLAMLVAQGVDPAEANKERRRQAVDLAFPAYVDLFAEGYLKSRWKRWEKTKAMLVLHAVPLLRRKALPNIKRSDLNALWDNLADRPALARLMHATLRKLFKWAVDRGDIERSPLEGATAPPRVEARDRVLTDDELALTWKAAGTLGHPFAGFYRLLIVTGQRREEVAGLDWRELDRDSALWTLPGERAKNGETHLIPFGEEAVALLDGVAGGAKWPVRGLLFTTTGRTPISGFAKGKTRLDQAMSKLAADDASKCAEPPHPTPPWRIHDIRRTVATGLQRLGVRFEVTEAVLNHVSGSRAGIAGVYQRHDWKDEKRAALAAWAEHVRSLERH